jgi:AcrR family transcriptional regulator
MTKPGKRDYIVQSSLELIAEHGFHGAPMNMIAERAGVGVGTIYLYFETKDVLINELYQEIGAKMYPSILNGYANKAPIRERFLKIYTSLLRYFIQFPLDFLFLQQFYNSPYGVAFRRVKLLGNESGSPDVFNDLFEEGAEQQIFKNLPPAVLLALAFGPLLAVARDHILGFVHLDETMIDRTINACWDSVKR